MPITLESIPFRHGLVKLGENRTLRVKVTNRCPFACEFCHREGSKISEDILMNDATIASFEHLRNRMGLTQAHLTGGEPTSHPDICGLIEILRSLGYEVKMTSNGHFDNDVLPRLRSAGISGINFSLHTLNPIRLANLQDPKRNFHWGLKALEKQLTNIKDAQLMGIPTKLNTVIQEDSHLDDIIDFCKQEKLELRILNELAPFSLSTKRIIDLLRERGAIIEAMNVATGTSAFSYDVVTNDGFRFRVKAIRKNTLASVCNLCDVRDSCKEWFYGIRAEQQNSRLMIRLCLERQDSRVLMTADDFLKSSYIGELAHEATL
jgi:cyclic pyranopterin phosphate synthase